MEYDDLDKMHQDYEASSGTDRPKGAGPMGFPESVGLVGFRDSAAEALRNQCFFRVLAPWRSLDPSVASEKSPEESPWDRVFSNLGSLLEVF